MPKIFREPSGHANMSNPVLPCVHVGYTQAHIIYYPCDLFLQRIRIYPDSMDNWTFEEDVFADALHMF